MASISPQIRLLLAAAAFLLIAYAIIYHLLPQGNEIQQPEPNMTNGGVTPEKVHVDVFVMSKCGFSASALMEFKQVVEAIGDGLEWRMVFVGEESGGHLSSLHGQPEVDGDIAQVCAKEHAPGSFLDFVVCMEQTPNAIPGNWIGCANKLGINEDDIRKCIDSGEGRSLLVESFRESASRGVSATPTIIIGGDEYTGGVKAIDIMRYVCGRSKDKPVGCLNLPAEVFVDAVILSDDRCSECQNLSASVNDFLPRLVPNLRLRSLDIGSEDGRQLYKETGIEHLPAVLFNESITRSDSYAQLSSYLKKRGVFYELNINSSWSPE